MDVQHSSTSSAVEIGIPDTRQDPVHDPKRIYWCQLTVREIGGVDKERRDKCIEETLMHWREAAECIYRGERAVSNPFYAARKYTLEVVGAVPMITVAGSVETALGDTLCIQVSEQGTGQAALTDAWVALDSKKALYKRLEAKLGVQVIEAIPPVKPSSVVPMVIQQQTAPGNVVPMPQTAPIYVGQKQSPKQYPYVHGQIYIFDTTAVSVEAKLTESGAVAYIWKLWGSYGTKGHGQYCDFDMSSTNEHEMKAVGDAMKALGLLRTIEKPMELKLRFTARCRVVDSKKHAGEKSYYFNPVKLEPFAEAEAVPQSQSSASW